MSQEAYALSRLRRSIQAEFGETRMELWEQGVPSASLGAPIFPYHAWALAHETGRARAATRPWLGIRLPRMLNSP